MCLRLSELSELSGSDNPDTSDLQTPQDTRLQFQIMPSETLQDTAKNLDLVNSQHQVRQCW